MKKVLLLLCFCISYAGYAQLDSVRVIEPNRETSFTNNELWWIVLAALAVLFAFYFLFRNRKSRR